MTKVSKKRGGKWKNSKREAVLQGIPRANINLYAEIEELIKTLKIDNSTETEKEKRKFLIIIDYLISR